MSTEDSKLVDLSLPVQTRSEREVKIYTTEGGDPEQPVIGERLNLDGVWVLFKRAANGRVSSNREDRCDLVNVPQQHTVWVNVFRLPDGTLSVFHHNSRAEADRPSGNRIACFEHTFTEGEGLQNDSK